MDGPTWTDRHEPTLAELPQPAVRDRLQRAVDQPMNLVIHGPPGTGKSAAARAVAAETHESETDLIVLNVADFFDRTKKEIRTDPRFEPLLAGRSQLAKRDMINRVLKESAANAPVSGTFKTVVLDNAEAIREDFQQALRRVMERYHRTTQFVLTTRQPSKLISPIRSRCFPVPVRAPTADEMMRVLREICDREDVAYDDDGIQFIAGAAGGDLREAILSAQTAATQHDEITMDTALETLQELGVDDRLESALEAVQMGEVQDARSTLDDLLYDDGFDGDTLLVELLRVARGFSKIDADAEARLHALAGEVDLQLADGTDDRLHLTHLLVAWADGRASIDRPIRATG